MLLMMVLSTAFSPQTSLCKHQHSLAALGSSPSDAYNGFSVINFHGYPSAVKQLLFPRGNAANPGRIQISGYMGT